MEARLHKQRESLWFAQSRPRGPRKQRQCTKWLRRGCPSDNRARCEYYTKREAVRCPKGSSDAASQTPIPTRIEALVLSGQARLAASQCECRVRQSRETLT